MPSMKISLLAMASAVAAVPHYGAHSRFHHKPSGAHGTGKPYPTGGWYGYNGTAVRHPTGTGYYTTGSDVTSTSTSTLVKTVIVNPSDSSAAAVVENVTPGSSDKCGPATITVTASDKVTVTVTAGGASYVPESSAAVPAESYGNGYSVASSAVVASSTPVEASSVVVVSSYPVEASSAPVVPDVTTSSQTEVYTTKAPEQPSSVVPEAASSTPEYTISSIVEKPVASVIASSAAPSSTSSPSSGNSYSGTKRGLAYNDAALCKTFGSEFGYGYNWAQTEDNDIGTQYIPMMHGPDKSTPEVWFANVDKAVKKGSRAVMGFNECDHPAQCNLAPAAACAAWKIYMNPIASSHPELTIVGPSVTNGQGSWGLGWLTSFKEVCPDAIFQATNIHFYDLYDVHTIDRFKAQVEKAAALYGKPVWVTEFGLNFGSATEEQAASFLKECMAYLDSSDKVQGYSWFMVGDGENMLNSGSGLSALGQVYASS